eukprot:gnl/TRDRNA2_/TRDRNA2_82830_c0_seq2.p1 gnl/TRDRNA2_/TRDRNA2_82830_c0~~gnl/TRDRNA2_/TRDRNA2_82830_c0_seq2.p1  ORF type:complete len:116 (+),score=2.15 gnl/TRDRNA2_/TRDRNA2_82830_c0_seq2:130-477(+)
MSSVNRLFVRHRLGRTPRAYQLVQQLEFFLSILASLTASPFLQFLHPLTHFLHFVLFLRILLQVLLCALRKSLMLFAQLGNLGIDFRLFPFFDLLNECLLFLGAVTLVMYRAWRL